jgi:hypothetical protein
MTLTDYFSIIIAAGFVLVLCVAVAGTYHHPAPWTVVIVTLIYVGFTIVDHNGYRHSWPESMLVIAKAFGILLGIAAFTLALLSVSGWLGRKWFDRKEGP